MRNFKFLSGDVNWQDYDGKWYRKVDEYTYHIIDLTNMQNACGRDATYTYNVALKVVDLSEIPEKEFERALEDCGVDLPHPISKPIELWDESHRLMLVELLSGQGTYAPIDNWGGDAYRPLMQSARARSREIEHPEEFEKVMNKEVNGIGSTAWEYMRGDIISPMCRALEPGHPKQRQARIMAKMYGAKEEDLPPLPIEPHQVSTGAAG